MVRPERFELPASWFVARRSIQLSYGRNGKLTARPFADCIGRCRLESAARPRQGREYYHINYGLLAELRSIPQALGSGLLSSL